MTLFRGWPDQAARLAADPEFATADLSSLGPGSLPAVLPADQRPAPGARANLFGMTETCGPYAGARLDLDLPEPAHGSCGKPFDGVEVRIVDVETGAPRAAGDAGEMRVRGRNVMRGICGRTRDATFDADGYYPTGDLGALDADGYLWFRGRPDDMFKVKGATVYPVEVEAALRAVAAVQQAHVTNVVDEDGTDEVGALVVSSETIDVLVAGVRERLSAFKVPTRWVVTTSVDTVPMTATSKVDKAALQDLLRRKGDASVGAGVRAQRPCNTRRGRADDPSDRLPGERGLRRPADAGLDGPRQGGLLQRWRLVLLESRPQPAPRRHGCPRRREGHLVDAGVGDRGPRARASSRLGRTASRSAVGGFDLLRPMPTVRALQAFVANHPVACAVGGAELLGRRDVPADRRRVLPAVHEVLRARSALVPQHGHPRAAAAGRTAEPHPHRSGLLPVPRTPAVR